jgi:hypothetical protein
MKKFTLALAFLFLGGWSYAQLATNDDFNSETEDPTKWATDLVNGHGSLTQTNQHVEFTVQGAPTAFDQSVRPWKVSRAPYTSDWEVQVDTRNTLILAGTTNQQVVAGLSIDDARGIASNEIIAVQVSGTAFSPQPYVGFMGRLGAADTGTFVSALNLPVTNGAIRIAFNSASKVLTLYYDAEPTNGYTWTQFGSFGINGLGGADANMSWGLTETNDMIVSIYGYAIDTAVTNDEVALDNFQATGLVAPLAAHSLAVTKMKVPKTINLSAKKPSITAKAAITIQNQGSGTEVITTATLTTLVTFQLQSLASASCAAPVPVLVLPKKLPVNLSPKKSLKLNYTITFDCANDTAKGTPDFSYSATVHPEAIDGSADTTPANNICPRPPSGADKGCGDKLGNALTTDVVVK